MLGVAAALGELHERRLGYLGMYMVPGTVPGMYMVPGTYNILNAYLPRYTRTSGDIDQSDLLRLLLIRKLETVGPLVKNSAKSTTKLFWTRAEA